MRKFVTFAALAGGALVLSACGGKAEEAPATEPAADEMMAPAEETPAADPAEAAAEDLDPTNNPIPPSQGLEAATAAE